LDVAQSVSAVEHLNGGKLQHVEPLRLAANPELIPKNNELRMLPIRYGN
jgi:hypothetical protein